MDIIHVREHWEGRVNGKFVVSGDTWNEVYEDLFHMGEFEMSKERWFDRNGVELQKGDMVRDITTGKEELVYECHPDGESDMLSLGLNASNERFLELHPEYAREIYPFSNFSVTWVSGQRWLDDYEKVV